MRTFSPSVGGTRAQRAQLADDLDGIQPRPKSERSHGIATGCGTGWDADGLPIEGQLADGTAPGGERGTAPE